MLWERPKGFIILHQADGREIYARASTIETFGTHRCIPPRDPEPTPGFILIGGRTEYVQEDAEEIAKLICQADRG